MNDLGPRLYRAMKDGQEASVRELLESASPGALNAPSEGPIPSPLISAVLSERLDFLR